MTSPRYPARLAAIALATLFAAPVFAQEDAARSFANKTVHLIVPYGAGGGNDIVARLVAGKISEGLGQPVVVENKPGASGIIGAEYVAKAPADGYTLFVGASGPMTANPSMFAKLSYSPLRDFVPISMIGSFPLLVMVKSSLPVKSIKDLVEYAKARPKEVSYSCASAAFQLAAEQFKQKTGTTFLYVPYKSAVEMLQAVISGQVTMTVGDLPPFTGALKSGTVRGLAMLAAKRHPNWPDIPSAPEVGLPGIEANIFIGLFAPAGTPQSVVKRLEKEVARAVKLPDIRERLNNLSIEPSGNTSEEFSRFVASEIAKWTAVAKAGNIRAEN